MPDHRQRNLTSSFTATGPREWKVVGGDRVGITVCGGGPTEAVVGCPDEGPPVLWQVAVCGPCLADTVMTRFAAVKHQRTVALAKDMNTAADEIVKLRSRARREKARPFRTARGRSEHPRKVRAVGRHAIARRHQTRQPGALAVTLSSAALIELVIQPRLSSTMAVSNNKETRRVPAAAVIAAQRLVNVLLRKVEPPLFDLNRSIRQLRVGHNKR